MLKTQAMPREPAPKRALWNMLIVCMVLAVPGALGLASYALFYPYVDTLKQKVAVNVTAFPALFALFLPAIRGEKPLMIPVYLVCFAAYFAIFTVLLHFVERLFRLNVASPI